MDEIEYKLNTKNSVLVVNAIDKLISTIKSKFKPVERQRFVLENEELKYLREKCSSKEAIVSLTACQGLLALVELGVLEIAHTMSTVVTLLPRAHNYSAIISTMSGLLVLDLKSRLVPGQPYKCQFSLKSPQHPFITVLERNKAAEDDVFAQMQALCTHPDYIVQSNSLELVRPVFLYLTCNPQQEGSIKPWQLLLSLPRTDAQTDLLLACLSCQQINSPSMLPRALAAYAAVTDAAIFQRDELYLAALMPMLAIISNRLVAHCMDPRPCYRLLTRCISEGFPGLRASAGLTLHLLAANISKASALSLHDTFALCLTILQKYDCPSLSVNALVAYTLQWLHLPSHLTTSALKIAAEIVDFFREKYKPNPTLNIPNLKSNKIFNYLANTDSKLIITVKLHSVWERIRDNSEKLRKWLDDIQSIDKNVKLEFLPFFYGLLMDDSEDTVLQVLKIVVDLVDFNKDVAVELMPILVYKIANDKSPTVKLECLKTLPLMAKTKENVPIIVSILNKLKSNKGVPTSFLIMLFATLAETQVRCFPYLQELLIDPGTGAGRPDDLKWEVDIARISAIKRICELRASSHGLELVPLISATLNRCSDRPSSTAAALSLRCIAALWKAAALSPHAAWRALQPRLERDTRPTVQASICVLLSEVPALSSNTPEFHQLSRSTASRLWRLLAEGTSSVANAAARALSHYCLDHYTLADIPEIYRKTVKLPASYCKTPADAARKPEDVLDYIPGEIWPEVFKYTNQEALPSVVYLVRKLIEREVGGFRSGVYHLEGGKESTSYGHLPPASVLRGVMDYCRKQIMSPSHECPDVVTLAMLNTLSCEYPKPLPPLEASFVPELCCRQGMWREYGVSLAARMAKVSPSARGVIENWIQGLQNADSDESDIILFYEMLPTFSRNFPPNTLRGPLERSLADSFTQIANVKAKVPYEQTLFDKQEITIKEADNDILKMEQDTKKVDNNEYLFIKQLRLMKLCLDCDVIHDANRTLLSQLLEHYFGVIADDNVAWPCYVETCTSLSAKYLERMTSPSGWWEVTPSALRKAGAVRGAVAASGGVTNPLYWLNEMIDAHAHEYTEQEYSLSYIFVSVRRASISAEAKQWFLQLLARTQAAFKETEDVSSKRYLYRVVCVCAGALSGVWALEPPPGAGEHAVLPAALPVLLEREGWGDCTLQVLEWLWHTRDVIGACDGAGAGAGAGCQRALLALRHTEPFATYRIWTRLESYFGKDIVQEC